MQCITSSDLPPLAWCARIDRGTGIARASCGAKVECGPGGFVEGAWNGRFEALDFASATVFAGTGGRLDGSHIRFAGSTDRLSPLFSMARGDTVWVSNSPVFALSAAGDAPDPVYPYYMYDMVRIWRAGLHELSGALPAKSGAMLRVHFGGVVSVDRNLELRCLQPPPGPAPHDYDSYVTLLVDGMKDIVRNAADPARAAPYTVLAALSRGYDSCATAALAKYAGCTKAITFCDSRLDDPQMDSGRSIAPALGMSCSEFDRWAYLALETKPEREFGFLSQSSTVTQASWERVLPGQLLISGRYGHVIWSKTVARSSDELSMSWACFLSGVGHIEFRLRVGYLEFAPAYIGARHHVAISNINNSEDMRPWSIGGEYDRPIPRRIAEEAGLPREAFGYQKAATGHANLYEPAAFTKAGLADYLQFVRERDARASRARLVCWRARVMARHAIWALKGAVVRNRHRFVKHSWMQRRFPFLANKSPARPAWEFMFLFQWCFSSVRHRYEATNELKSDETFGDATTPCECAATASNSV